MDFDTIKEKDTEYIANTYARFRVALERGEGALLYGVDGKEYIDFTSGIGVNIFGANDEEWKNAVIGQINKLQHACNLYYTVPQVKLAELLCKKTGAKKVFFGNSGAEANECAIKTARKYNSDKYGDGKRYEIIVLKNSFHGRTIATLSATAQDAFHKHFSPFLEGFKEINPSYDDFLSAVNEKTGAVMMELIQGESGVNTLDKEFVKRVYSYCMENDILFIDDEVQTGNGRTGTLYAYEQFDIIPDIVTTAKGLGGGLPIGACLMYERTEKTLSYGDHGSTFGGNPVSCAGAYSIISRIDDALLSSVKEKGDYIRKSLKGVKGVSELSGLGLMVGIKTEKAAKDIAAECLNNGLFVLTAHDKVRLLPPLNIDGGLLEKGIQILTEVIKK